METRITPVRRPRNFSRIAARRPSLQPNESSALTKMLELELE